MKYLRRLKNWVVMYLVHFFLTDRQKAKRRGDNLISLFNRLKEETTPNIIYAITYTGDVLVMDPIDRQPRALLSADNQGSILVFKVNRMKPLVEDILTLLTHSEQVFEFVEDSETELAFDEQRRMLLFGTDAIRFARESGISILTSVKE